MEKNKKQVEQSINFGRELVMIFSNKKSLFSSKKIERTVVFLTFLIVTVVYLVKKLNDLEALDLIQITGLWLAYGGYNSIMNLKDRKLEAGVTETPEQQTETTENGSGS